VAWQTLKIDAEGTVYTVSLDRSIFAFNPAGD
jgi:hypothetical protein